MLEQYEDALKYYKEAIKLEPNSVEINANLTNILVIQNPNDADKIYLEFLERFPNHPRTCNNLAYFYLPRGNLFEGFKYYEYRSDPSIKNCSTIDPNFNFPKWDGESLVNKSIMVLPEQGFGDQIQFIRYISLLKETGASKICVVCDLGLKPLFELIPEIDMVAAVREPVLSCNYWTHIGSLPYHFRTTLQTVPVKIPYLLSTEDKITKFKNLLPKDKIKIGICWRGNKKHYNNKNRSVNLDLFAPLWNISSNIEFVSIQIGDGLDEIKEFEKTQPMLTLNEHIEDFLDTAGLFTNLDMLISVDTSVVHLAGAMGLKSFVLLPAIKTDWRWLEDGDKSYWYPTLKLFRQKDAGDWSEVIENIKNDLTIECKNLI